MLFVQYVYSPLDHVADDADFICGTYMLIIPYIFP